MDTPLGQQVENLLRQLREKTPRQLWNTVKGDLFDQMKQDPWDHAAWDTLCVFLGLLLVAFAPFTVVSFAYPITAWFTAFVTSVAIYFMLRVFYRSCEAHGRNPSRKTAEGMRESFAGLGGAVLCVLFILVGFIFLCWVMVVVVEPVQPAAPGSLDHMLIELMHVLTHILAPILDPFTLSMVLYGLFIAGFAFWIDLFHEGSKFLHD